MQTQTQNERGLGLARVALVIGSAVCLVLTPSFAMAYFRAYGYSGGESPPGWLADGDWPTWISGSGRVSTYNRLGVVFGLALLIVVVALVRVVAVPRMASSQQRRAWWLIIGGLGAVAVGSLLEYGIPDDAFDPSNGFMLELLGFLSVAVGTVVLGLAMRRELGIGRLKATALGLIGPVGVVGGAALVGHLPSGPASVLLVAAIAIGVSGLPSVPRER